MLKKKKQNVFFRFGLKPQQGVLVASFVLPREEYKNLLMADWHYNTNVDRTRNQFELVVTTSNNKKILVDNRLGTGEVYGPTGGIENNEIPILTTDPDKASYGGLGFLMYINENKDVVYRYTGGVLEENIYPSREVISSEVFDPPISIPMIQGLVARKDTYIERKLQSVSIFLQIKEKKIPLISLTEETEGILYQKATSETTGTSQIMEDYYSPEGEIQTVRGSVHIDSKSGQSMDFALSPMHSIFIANHTWENDVQNGWQRKTKTFNIIDKDGDSSVSVTDGSRPTKIFSTRPDNGEGQLYWENWSFYDEAWPTVLKSNNKEDFLMLPQTGPAFILKDENKYLLGPGSFDINGTKYNIGYLYPLFFATENMMHQRWKYFSVGGWKKYNFHGSWGFGAWRERGYMTYSWFGDYIYRIRIDELIDEPLFSQNAEEVIRLQYPNNPQPEIDLMLGFKAKAELLGFKGGAFFLDVLNNATTDQQMKDLARFIGIAGGINNFLKIYQPDTNKLWVEKFQIQYSEDQAQIVFKERFVNPFYSPLTTSVLSCGDWDIDTLEKYIPALKSICYIPYDYVPPVAN